MRNQWTRYNGRCSHWLKPRDDVVTVLDIVWRCSHWPWHNGSKQPLTLTKWDDAISDLDIVGRCSYWLWHSGTMRSLSLTIWRILGREVTLGLVSAFVTTRLDYCNSVLAGLPQVTIDPLQPVQNAVAGLVAGIGTRDHITPVLRSLHCLPIRLRIYSTSCACLCTWCASVAVLPTWLTWWQPPPTYPVVRNSVLPTVSDTKPQNWSSSLVSGVSHIRWTEGVELTSFQYSGTNEHW